MHKNLFIIHAYPLVAAIATILGVSCYFILPIEPSVTIGMYLSIATALFSVWLYKLHRHLLPVIGLVFFSISFTYSAFYSQSINTVFLPERYEGEQLWARGKIVDIWPGQKRSTLELKHVKIYGLLPEETPEIIKVGLDNKRASQFSVGHWVSAQVVLQQPNPPQFAGDYNQQRSDYFEGIGARGYVMGGIYSTWVDKQERYDTIAVDIQHLRSKVDATVTQSGTEASAIASALLTGIKGKISPNIYDSFRHSGLAHVLAISGLHLALFGGFIFVLLRRLLCLWPSLVLKYSSKKIAAVGALLGAFGYMLLAGATIPTMRAFIMVGLLFTAVLCTRVKMSMRSLCIAVIVILFIYPHSVLTASFQMSFAAVFALILWNAYKEEKAKSRMKLVTFTDYVKATALTALIAGLATMPIAAWHFQEISIGGFIANIVAIPVTAMWIMPCGLFALILMPLDWHQPVLSLMEEGIEVLIMIAQKVESIPFSHFDINLSLFGFILVTAAAILALIFTPVYWKRTAMVALACYIGLVFVPSKNPDITWLAGGDAVLLTTEGGVKEMYSQSTTKRVISHYTKQYKAPLIQSKSESCDSVGCVYEISETRLLALESGMLPTTEDCRLNDLILPLHMGRYCSQNNPLAEEPFLYAHGWLNNGGFRYKIYTQNNQRIWQ
jgi:competence protein ComEC